LRTFPFRGIMSGMEWTTPAYDEIKMDAEIGSYQEDGEPVPIVERQQQGEASPVSAATE
jgi:hypothetical protein